MTNSGREVIRRLLKGDHLTEIRAVGGKYSYIIGYNGNSPLRAEERLASYLISEGFLEYSAGEENNSYVYENENSEAHYMLSTQSKSYEKILRKPMYSLGDTVAYEYQSHPKRFKGVITKEFDPLCQDVLINGITNETHCSSNFIGITRMVLIEKTIKNKRAAVSWQMEGRTKISEVECTQEIENANLIVDFDPYDYGRNYEPFETYDYE